MRSNPQLVFIGPLPPPVHGMAVVNARVVALLSERIRVEVIKVAPAEGVAGIRYHLSKGIRAVCGAARLVRARLKGARLLYASVDDRWGGLYTLLFVSLARAIGLRTWLHHHSYRYIVRKSRIMEAITISAGPRTTHVMLCDEMEDDFLKRYPAARHFAVIPNAVSNPEVQPAPKVGGPLTIGLLANLTFEKGLREFVEILKQSNSDVRGILAGPAGADEAEFIQASIYSLQNRLEWIGPVSGAAKEAYFAKIDLFVFPTRYETEALPLVLLEALLRAVPVIAPARGAIGLYSTVSAADIVPLSEDFIVRAVERVRILSENPTLLAEMKSAARVEGGALNAVHEAELNALADTLVAEASGRAS